MTARKKGSEEDKGARVWEEDIVKPTYRMLKEDPLPHFLSKHYPYTKLDLFNSKPTPVKYKEIVMENEYLRLAVRPELGARLFSAYDKTAQDHIFNYIETIRPTLIAARGAWIAVGLEFNVCQFPSHTTDNFSLVDYAYRKNKDGSASILLGNLNLTNNVRYLTVITLRPHSAAIETEIRTFNTDLIPQRYYVWSNAGIPTTEGLRLFYPGYKTHGKFPIDEQGIDRSWYKNYVRSSSVFMLDSEEDFFAEYNYDISRGVVHHADHHIVPGKKFWTWGTSEDGLFWKDLLSDKGIPYIEIQSGRFLTQGIVEFMNPMTFESWTEYWYPVRGIGGVTYANSKASLYTEVTEGDERKLHVGIFSAITCEEAKLELYQNGKRFYEERVSMSPKEMLLKEIKVPSGKLLLKIVDSVGDEIISWDFRKYKTMPHEAPSWEGEMPKWNWGDTAEELWLKGIDVEKRETRLMAKRYFEDSLKKDGGFSRGLSSLGLLHYQSGLYDKAAESFQRALKRDPYDEDALYYLSLTMVTLDKCEDAERELWKLYSVAKQRTLVFYLLGIMKMRAKAYNEAEEMFRRSIQEYGFNLKALAMLSAALRKQGKDKDALDVIEKAYEIMPLDYLVLAERHFLSSDKESERVVFADFQKVLEVSKDYMFAGLFKDSLTMLKAALSQGISNPIIHYYIGYALKKIGRPKEAIECYEKGGKEKIDYMFPHRLEEIIILEDVVKTVPSSPVPYYLLGNVLFYRERMEEGLEKWEEAYKLGLENAVLYRNIGYAYDIMTKEIDKSIGMYLDAIRLEPQNHKLYAELDDIYSKAGRFAESVRLLENVPREARRSSLLARLSSAYIDIGEYDKSLDILVNTFFEPMEGYYGFWDIYVDALLAKGLTLLKKNRVEESVKYFTDATKYPRNLGIGAPHPRYRQDVMQLYYAGLAHEKLGDTATAQKIWNEALERSPELSNEHSVFEGLVLRKLGREEESKSLIKKIIDENKSKINNPYARYVTGLAYLAEGRTKEGLKEIDSALEIAKTIRHARWVKDGIITV